MNKMTFDHMKKELYRQNLEANFVHAKRDHMVYRCQSTIPEYFEVHFVIPYSDIGEATFEALMPAKLLIRYMLIKTS